MWICRQHGKNCRSYVEADLINLNEKKITPKDLEKFPKTEREYYEKVLKWID